MYIEEIKREQYRKRMEKCHGINKVEQNKRPMTADQKFRNMEDKKVFVKGYSIS